MRGHGEIDDRGGAEQLERRGDQLAKNDRRLRIAELAGAEPQCREFKQGAEHVERDRAEHDEAYDARELAIDVQKPRDKLRLAHEHQPTEQDRAKHEGESGEHHEHADFGRGEPLRRIGAVSHRRSREDRGADVVGERVGR